MIIVVLNKIGISNTMKKKRSRFIRRLRINVIGSTRLSNDVFLFGLLLKP